VNSRAKGKNGELELAAFLREHGFEARRGQQFSGGDDSPDVVHDIPGVHIECKRVEQGNLYDWLAQAKRDARSGTIPLVAHRRNRQEWVAILPLEDLLALLQDVRTLARR
jgi:Holliday junction resolvase